MRGRGKTQTFGSICVDDNVNRICQRDALPENLAKSENSSRSIMFDFFLNNTQQCTVLERPWRRPRREGVFDHLIFVRI